MLAIEPAEPLARRVVVRGDQLALEEAIEIAGELARVLVALVRVVGERLVDDRGEVRRDPVDLADQRLGLTVDGRAHHLVGGLRVVRRLAQQQVVERRAERVDIRALVRGRAAQLLRRHEAGRAVDHAGAGLDRVGVVGPRRDQRDRADLGLGLAHHLREAPVDHDGLAELADEDVRRLDVAVDDAALVRVRDRVRRRDDVGDQAEPLGERGGLPDDGLERLPLDLAHHVERRMAGPGAGVVDRHDRRMLEARGDPDLALEAGERVGVDRERLLERDDATEHGILRLDDAAHTAARDLEAELVAGGGQRRRRAEHRRLARHRRRALAHGDRGRHARRHLERCAERVRRRLARRDRGRHRRRHLRRGVRDRAERCRLRILRHVGGKSIRPRGERGDRA